MSSLDRIHALVRKLNDLHFERLYAAQAGQVLSEQSLIDIQRVNVKLEQELILLRQTYGDI